MREVHPELCFRAFNDCQPMTFSKKKPTGRAERLVVLTKEDSGSEEIYEQACSKFLRKVVGRDDVLDALVGLPDASFILSIRSLAMSIRPVSSVRT